MVGWYVIAFVLGASIGSFLNVCIYRIPRDLSINLPRRSFCPSCCQQLKAFDNIPIVSYLILRGKCRQCGSKISIRYPIVELLTALTFVFMLNRFDLSLQLLSAIVFVSLLITIAIIDLDFYIIPNCLILAGIIAGLILAITISIFGQIEQASRWGYLTDRLLGTILGAAMIEAIALIGKLVFRKEAMGMGDVKLMGMIGMFLGVFPHLLVVLVSSAFIGSAAGIVLILLSKRKLGARSEIPYGPFLSIGAIFSLLYGDWAWALYMHLY